MILFAKLIFVLNVKTHDYILLCQFHYVASVVVEFR